MRRILLSADGEISVFRVPDRVADQLEKYCLEFCRWLRESPDAAEYRVVTGDGLIATCFTEKDFISYLNRRMSDEPSSWVETLSGVFVGDKLPDEYKRLPYFNF